MSVWVYVCQTRSLSYRGLRCLCGCMSVKQEAYRIGGFDVCVGVCLSNKKLIV